VFSDTRKHEENIVATVHVSTLDNRPARGEVPRRVRGEGRRWEIKERGEQEMLLRSRDGSNQKRRKGPCHL